MDLFTKMKSYGLNAYLYAPKDDHKHRALWREAYDGTERNELRPVNTCILSVGCFFALSFCHAEI